MTPLSQLTFADSAGVARLSPAQQLLSGLPVVTVVPPGSALLAPPYERAVLITSYAGGNQFWAAQYIRTATGRVLGRRSIASLGDATSPVEARQSIMAAHASSLLDRSRGYLEATIHLSYPGWISATINSPGHVAQTTCELLAALGLDPSRVRAALALAGKANPQHGTETGSVFALLGADPLPADVPSWVVTCLRKAALSRSNQGANGGPFAHIDLREGSAGDWYAGLAQMSPTNALLRLLARLAESLPAEDRLVQVDLPTGEVKRYHLDLDPAQPHGSFTCSSVAAPASTLSWAANGVRP